MPCLGKKKEAHYLVRSTDCDMYNVLFQAQGVSPVLDACDPDVLNVAECFSCQKRNLRNGWLMRPETRTATTTKAASARRCHIHSPISLLSTYMSIAAFFQFLPGQGAFDDGGMPCQGSVVVLCLEAWTIDHGKLSGWTTTDIIDIHWLSLLLLLIEFT